MVPLIWIHSPLLQRKSRKSILENKMIDVFGIGVLARYPEGGGRVY